MNEKSTTSSSSQATKSTDGKTVSQDASTVTERGADGWPTSPTPRNLVPRLGELPVSSTAHFQTVVVNRLEATSELEMESKFGPKLDEIFLRRAKQQREMLLKKAWMRSHVVNRLDAKLPEGDEACERAKQELLNLLSEYDLVLSRVKDSPPERMAADLGSYHSGLRDAEYLAREAILVSGSGEKVRNAAALKVESRKLNIPPEELMALTHRGVTRRKPPEKLQGWIGSPSGAKGSPEIIQKIAEWTDSQNDSRTVAERRKVTEEFYKATLPVPVPVTWDELYLLYSAEPAIRYTMEVAIGWTKGVNGRALLETIIKQFNIKNPSFPEYFEQWWRARRQQLTPSLPENGDPQNERRSGPPASPREIADLLSLSPYPGIVRQTLYLLIFAWEFADLDAKGQMPRASSAELKIPQAKPYDWEAAETELEARERETLANLPKDSSAVFKDTPLNTSELLKRLKDNNILPADLDSKARSLESAVDALLGIRQDSMLDPLTADDNSMTRPAEGVLLYHEQGWFARGLALGNLLHSVALAPGEVTQIAMTHWNHSTRASDSETESQLDSSAEYDQQDRSVSEIQSAAAQEHASGGSFGSSSSSSAEAGISGFFYSASAATTNTVSSAFSFSSGEKSMAMQANQMVSATTGRQAEAARTRRATVVREISQTEDQSVITRVLANYNHMHALTVMYFEVIEVYDLKTRVVDAERLIFLPFKVQPVKELIPRFRSTLIDAAFATRRPDLAEAIRHYQRDNAYETQLNERLTSANADIATLKAQVATLEQESIDLAKRYEDRRNAVVSRLDGINAKRNGVFEGLKQLAGLSVVNLQQFIQAQVAPLDDEANQLRGQLDTLRSAEYKERSRIETSRQLENANLREATLRRDRLIESQRVLKNLADSTRSGPFTDLQLYFNQAAWLALSPSQVLGMARVRYKNEVLCESIDPTPVGISGNYVAYRWRFSDMLEEQSFKRRHVAPYDEDSDEDLCAVSSTIAVPTGGVFAEAVLGEAVSAEKIDLSRFWNWKDSPIPILPPSINPINAATATVQDLDSRPTGLAESSAKLGQLQDLPTPSGFGELANSMRSQIFRDMSGMDMVKSLAEATTKAAASGANNAGQLASSNFRAGLDLVKDLAPQVLSAMAGPETGGASLMGGLMNAKQSGKSGAGSAIKNIAEAVTGDSGSAGDLLDSEAGVLAGGGGGAKKGGKDDDGSKADRSASASGTETDEKNLEHTEESRTNQT